jgi:hypothetical protein
MTSGASGTKLDQRRTALDRYAVASEQLLTHTRAPLVEAQCDRGQPSVVGPLNGSAQ